MPSIASIHGPVPSADPFRNRPSVLSVNSCSTLPSQLDLAFNWGGLLQNFPLITVPEAAQDLKCSDQHIRNFIDELKLLAFPINLAPEAKRKRNNYLIVRQSAATAFTFIPSRQREEFAHTIIRTVNDWLFRPFDPDIGAWQTALRIGSRSVLTIRESSMALRCSGQHIRELYDARLLSAVDISSPAATQLQTLRITRESLAAFVAIRLARQNNLEPAKP